MSDRDQENMRPSRLDTLTENSADTRRSAGSGMLTRRRALAGAILVPAIALAATSGPEFVNSITKPFSPENSRANYVTTVDQDAIIRLGLDASNHYGALIFPGGLDQNLMAVSEQGGIEGNQIKSIEGKPVLPGATAFEVKNPGANDEGQMPLIVTFEDSGKVLPAVLEPLFPTNGELIQQGNIRTVNGSVERNAQGQRTETGTGLTVDQISFITSTASPSETH